MMVMMRMSRESRRVEIMPSLKLRIGSREARELGPAIHNAFYAATVNCSFFKRRLAMHLKGSNCKIWMITSLTSMTKKLQRSGIQIFCGAVCENFKVFFCEDSARRASLMKSLNGVFETILWGRLLGSTSREWASSRQKKSSESRPIRCRACNFMHKDCHESEPPTSSNHHKMLFDFNEESFSGRGVAVSMLYATQVASCTMRDPPRRDRKEELGAGSRCVHLEMPALQCGNGRFCKVKTTKLRSISIKWLCCRQTRSEVNIDGRIQESGLM